jgi:uncharacterized membrane protein
MVATAGLAVAKDSAYAKLAGVPVAVLGVGAYVTVLVCMLGRGARARAAAALVAWTGFAFSAWLTYVEVAVLEAICVWCVASAICMTALAMLCSARLLEAESQAAEAA